MKTQQEWDIRFLKLAKHIGEWSSDTSLKVAAVIVGPDLEIITTGYNGQPRGSLDKIGERDTRPLKYSWYEHAERNAIFNAARIGVSVKGATVYCESNATDEESVMSCVECVRAIIQSGITRLVQRPLGRKFHELSKTMGGWRQSCNLAIDMLSECGVKLDFVKL